MLKAVIAACAFMFATLLADPGQAQSTGTKVLSVAEVYEPQTLDPTTSTADLISVVTQGAFETLYTYDQNWQTVPMLAAAMPETSADGKTVTIKLRSNVPFHDGTIMTADDVVASLLRWEKLSPRGKIAAAATESISAKGADTVEIKLKAPFSPLVSLLAYFNSAAAIMPKAKAEAAMDGPITDTAQLIGTGPFRITERKPDQYVRLTKFDRYAALSTPPSLLAGKREALVDEVRFVPVPNASTRLEGVLSGQYDVGDGLSAEFYERVKKSATTVPLVTKPGSWILFVMNNKDGLTKNLKIRKAVQAALDSDSIMLAAFGSPDFFSLHSSLYPEGSPFFAKAGANLYNQKNTKLAKQLLQEAGYKGEPFRILASQQYDFLYKAALVSKQNLEDAGFKVELVMMDWASVMSKRNTPEIWEAFLTFHGFVPEPSLYNIVNSAYAGWWDSPAKNEAMTKFNVTVDPKERAAVWENVQALMMEEVPTVVLGEFYNLIAHSKAVKGMHGVPLVPFWNVSKN